MQSLNKMNNDVDLTNCDKEPIHKLGKIQNYGGLLGFSENWEVVYCSENISSFCDLSVKQCIGKFGHEIFLPEIMLKLKQSFIDIIEEDQTERLFGEFLFGQQDIYDISIHFSANIIVVEFEYHQALVPKNSLSNVRSALKTLSRMPTLESFFIHATDTMASLTSFDRIMLYRFHNDGSGEVIAESIKNDMDSFLGLRYPASDIPKQARRLYIRNLTRLIENVDADTVKVFCSFDVDAESLDLSMSVLRAVSPIHIEYLKNMGIQGSFSLSIVVDGELWGLFACHHNSSQYISLEMRSIIEVFGEVFSLELSSRLKNLSLVNTEKARSLHVKMMSSLNSEASIFDNVAPFLQSLQRLVPSDSAFLWVDKKLAKVGFPMPDEDAHLIIAKLNALSPSDIVCTDNIKGFLNPEITVAERYSGFLAVPISRFPRDFLVFLRKEETQSISWAGNPDKPVSLGPNGIRLTPRKSFAAWQEVRKGYSAPWLQKEIGLAQLLKQMLLEVVIRNIDERERLTRESQQQQDVLISELNHRVRNILGLISSVVSKTATGANDVSEFKEVLGGRINSIAVAQNHLTEQNWSHAPLKKLIEVELSAYLSDKPSNVVVDGPDIYIAPKAYTTLTLVIHELVTNAVKHGALFYDTGELEIKWCLTSASELKLTWRENGYDNQPSTRKGFGTVIINRSLPFDLNGTADVKHHATGIDVTLTIPSTYVYLQTANDSIEESLHANTTVSYRKRPDSVLILEDNLIIALDIEDTLKEASIQHVYIAANTVQAEEIITQKSIGFAILDVNLGGENSYSVGKLCQKLGIPFVFVTGYNELQGVKDKGFDEVQLLLKPVNPKDIVAYVKGYG